MKKIKGMNRRDTKLEDLDEGRKAIGKWQVVKKER